MDHIADIIARIQAQCPDIETVEEAWFAAPLEDLGAELPAAMIYLQKEDPLGPANTLQPKQPTRWTYGVWLVCNRDQFREQRKSISDALFSYQPTEHTNPMEYQGGALQDIKGDLIWWLESWSYDTHKRG